MTARAPMKPQRLTIPAPAPWINANARDHWTKKGRLTRSWRSASAAWARHQKLRPVTQPVVIVATVVKTNSRRFDVENLAPTVKAAIDGLRDSGVLPEDDTRWVTEVRLRAGNPDRAASLSCSSGSATSGHPVVADVPQIPGGTIPIVKDQPSLLPAIQEVALREGGLEVALNASRPTPLAFRQEKIPQLRIVERLGGFGVPNVHPSGDSAREL